MNSPDNHTKDRSLPKGFPDLFGCRRHRPRSVELRRWNEPLSDDHLSRVTIVSGLTWTLACNQDDAGRLVTVVDCTWSADGLQELGVDLAVKPLVAIQTWDDAASLQSLVNCDRCEQRLRQLDDVLISHWSDGTGSTGDAQLPRFPRINWTDSPAVVADAVINTGVC